MMRFFVAGCSLMALAGCELGPYAPDYGDATHNNIAVQSVQPTPPPAAQPVPANGALAAVAQDRYEKDHIKQPAAITTSNTAGAGSGGGGGGQSGQ